MTKTSTGIPELTSIASCVFKFRRPNVIGAKNKFIRPERIKATIAITKIDAIVSSYLL
jgi:hypothetical protein